MRLVSLLLLFLVGGQLAQTFVIRQGDRDTDVLMDLAMARANEQFAMHMMQILESTSAERKNVFIAPSSINTVLLMVMAASDTQSYMELYRTLGFLPCRCSDRQIFETYRRLTDQLMERTMQTHNVLEVANTMALQKEFSIRESFTKNMTQYFKTQVVVEDFLKEPHKATQHLNELVSMLTHGIIPNYYEQDLQTDTVMVLLNAVYFKGQWQYKFDKQKTRMDVFQTDAKQLVAVEMMHIEGHFNYSRNDEGQLVELPYENGTLAMYVFVPDAETSGSRRPLSSYFQHKGLQQRIDQMENSTLTLLMPKFKMQHSYSLRQPLEEAGIRQIFTSQADLSRINGHKNLSVSQINHKTFIEVTEEGTKATGVTDGQINFRSLRQTMRVDRPFVFFIRDKVSQLTLFSGIVNHPEN